MKKVALVFIAAIGLGFAGIRADYQGTVARAYVAQDDEREMIKVDELPEDVREVLNGNDYRGWIIHKAWRVTPKNAAQYYEVHLKQKKDIKVVYFDETGQTVEPNKKGSGKPE